MSRLKEKYEKEIKSNLKTNLNISNVNLVPKLEKVVVNVGAGEAVQNPKVIDFILNDIKLITGQTPVVTRAKKSIAGFKLREGQPIGVMVTLRSTRMFEFLDRVVSVALPRVRDFKGISPKAFDAAGNYTLSFKEQLVFPEIDFDKTDKVRGLSATFVFNTNNADHSKALMSELGFQFR